MGLRGATGDPGAAGKQVDDWRKFLILVFGVSLKFCLDNFTTWCFASGQAWFARNSGNNRGSWPQGMLVYPFYISGHESWECFRFLTLPISFNHGIKALFFFS